MLRQSFWGLTLGVVLFTATTAAQDEHAGDLQFKYDGNQIVILNGEEGFEDGKKIFEAEMGFGDPLVEGFTDEPGFISELPDLGIGANDTISFNFLETRFGGFLNFWNPATGEIESTLSTIDLTKGLENWTISQLVGASGVLGQADEFGDFHAHFDIQLSAGSTVGAYALLMELESDRSGIAKSDPFYIVFGYGIDETQHGAAVAKFAGVPEPGSLGIIAAAAIGGLVRLRRRRSC